jgi:transcriptional regulator with XRE-family HTH domain
MLDWTEKRCTMTGQELRAIRREVGWTQARLAEYLELSTNYLARLERGKYPISERTARDVDVLYMVYKLALALGLIET